MISPELLRRYSFFGRLNEDQVKAIAMIADINTIEAEKTLFEEGQPAKFFYLLLEGGITLLQIGREIPPMARKEFHVGVINPGEVFSLSALMSRTS